MEQNRVEGDGQALGAMGNPSSRGCGPTITSLSVTADLRELSGFVKPQPEDSR